MKYGQLFTTKIALSFLLIITLATTGIGFYTIKNIHFSTDVERLFENDNSSINFYRKFKAVFLDQGLRSLVTVKTIDSINNYETLKKIQLVTDSINQIPLVLSSQSISTLKQMVRVPFMGHIVSNKIDLDEDLGREYYSQSIDKQWLGTLVAKDYKGFSIHIIMDAELEEDQVTNVERRINSILQKNGFDSYYLTGRLFGKFRLLDLLKTEIVFYLVVCFVLIALILFFLYGKPLSVLSLITVLVFSLIWTFGFMVFWGKPIGVLNSVVPPIIFVIGTSDVIHIFERFRNELSKGFSKLEAIKKAFYQLSRATLITSATTMIGFLSLTSSSVIQVRELGVFVAGGVAITYLLTFSLFPAILLLIPESKFIQSKKRKSFSLKNMLPLVFKHQKAISIFTVLLVAFAIWAAMGLKADNYLTEDLPKNHYYTNAHDHLRGQYSGGRPFELAIKDGEFLDEQNRLRYDKVQSLFKLTNHIRDAYKTEAIFSLEQILLVAIKADQPDYSMGDPLSKAQFEQSAGASLYKILNSSKAGMFFNNDSALLRVSGLVPDEGGAHSRELSKSVRQYAKDSCNLDAQVTGLAYIMDESNELIVGDMIKSLGMALLLIGILMAFIFRSTKLMLIALLPNLLPLILLAGCMALLNIDLKISTALIFAIAFGIVVDDTIHFLSKLKQELTVDNSIQKAIERTYVSTGKSIVVTSIILCFGFIALSTSDFTSTADLGLLISISLFLAVISDLVWLPILLLWLKKSPKEKRSKA